MSKKSSIPDRVIADKGKKALVTIGTRKLIITCNNPVTLRPNYTEEELNSSVSLKASLEAKFIVPYIGI